MCVLSRNYKFLIKLGPRFFLVLFSIVSNNVLELINVSNLQRDKCIKVGGVLPVL